MNKTLIKTYASLLRVDQWYKNLLVFLPIIFGLHILYASALIKTVVGFVCFCLVSSANYIINDWNDQDADRVHPEKKNRPLTSGAVDEHSALWIAGLFFVVGITLSFLLTQMFGVIMLTFAVLTQAYTFVFKEEAFADLLLIAINFVLRAVAGAYVIVSGIDPYIRISPWLVLCTFFLALFLVAGKRQADLRALGKKAVKHKQVFAVYTEKLTDTLVLMTTTLLVACYSLYIFFNTKQMLFLTLPFALYGIFRYYYLIQTGHLISRRPELAYKDGRLLATILLWMLTALFALYVF